MISEYRNNPIRQTLQHYLNSLHVYSFACRMRVGRGKAMKAACLYEKIVHPLIYVKKKSNLQISS